MRKMMLMAILMAVFSSCELFQESNAKAPTLIVDIKGAVISAPAVGVVDKDLGSTQATFYDITAFGDNLELQVRVGSNSDTLHLTLHQDSTKLVQLIDGKVIVTSHQRYFKYKE